VELLLQTTSLVYQAIYEIKWFFYMIMNKLYYVVGLVLLLLFALTKEDRRGFLYGRILSPSLEDFHRKDIQITKKTVYYKAIILIIFISFAYLCRHVG